MPRLPGSMLVIVRPAWSLIRVMWYSNGPGGPSNCQSKSEPQNAELDGLRIHDLRHTAVALWIAAGANPKEVAARAGHTSASFTLDRYGHLYPESDAALRDRLDALYSAASVTKTPPWWTYFRSAHGPGAIPEHGGRRRHSADNGCGLRGAAHR